MAIVLEGFCDDRSCCHVYCHTHRLWGCTQLARWLRVQDRSVVVDLPDNGYRHIADHLDNGECSRYQSGTSRPGDEFANRVIRSMAYDSNHVCAHFFAFTGRPAKSAGTCSGGEDARWPCTTDLVYPSGFP